MLDDTHLQTVVHAENGHGNDGDGEDRVGREHHQIKRTDRAGSLKARDDAVPQIVIEDVTGEEDERGRARREHQALVERDVLVLDGPPGRE